jgi:hypothetical protein
MALIPVPTLSAGGFITAPSDKADMLLSHFFESEKSQTALYGDGVSSLQWILEQYGHDISTVTNQIRSVLEGYLSKYYTSAIVTVSSNESTVIPSTSITLTIHASVVEEGVTYSIGKLIETSNSKITKITKINNGV